MDKNLKERLLNEAIRIGEDIYSKRKEDENGIYWETMNINYGEGPKFVWNVSENIYSGVSGIVLFYIALYKITKDEKYLKICKDAMRWVVNYCKKNKTHSYAFLTGRSGIAFTLLKLDKICNCNYIENALEIMKDCDNYINSGYTACEYLNGASGTLLVLLHLFNASNESWVLEKIYNYTKYIIENSYYNLDGLHWDRNSHSIKSLCGFSHGAAGVGYVFLELGYNFNNPVFYYLAEQAFSYESNFYRDKEKNWLDLRKSFITENDKMDFNKAIEEKNYAYFYEERFMSAWCHGAPGIGLTRLRGYELIGNEKYQYEYNAGLENVLNVGKLSINNFTSFTLCHGIGGNLDLAIESQKKYYESEVEMKLELIVAQMLDTISERKFYTSGYFHYTGDNEDYSMFIGNAGIGYFYLRLIDSEIVESILMPSVKKKNNIKDFGNKYYFSSLNSKKIKKILLEKVFKTTLRVFEVLFVKEFIEYTEKPLADSRENQIIDFMNYINELLLSESKETDLLKDIYLLEKEKLILDKEIKSYALANYWYTHPKDDVNELIENDKLLLNAELEINPDVRLYESKWDWKYIKESNCENINEEEKNPTLLLLIATYLGVKEENISSFCFCILENFEEKEKVENVLANVIDLFDEIKENDKNAIKIKAIEQIKNLLKDGILIYE